MRRDTTAVATALAAVLVCLILGAAARSADTPTARELMDDVLARLPAEPLLVTAHIQAKGLQGKPDRVVNVEALLDFGAQPASATYTIFDAFGSKLEQLTVLRNADGTTEYNYRKGEGAGRQPAPAHGSAVQKTDITWSDLALSFLWWRNGSVLGEATAMERRCYIVEVRPPADPKGQARTVKLWIEQNHRMLFQAEEYDQAGKLLRRLQVKSFKKIEERWMMKDLLVETPSTGTKTYLRVTDMRLLQPAAEPPAKD